jgi:hypothetical protein
MAETGLSRASIYAAAARLRELVPCESHPGGKTVWLFPADPTADLPLSTPVQEVDTPVQEVDGTGPGGGRKPRRNRKEPRTVPAALSVHPALHAQRQRELMHIPGRGLMSQLIDGDPNEIVESPMRLE